jgi:hypothetical protein
MTLGKASAVQSVTFGSFVVAKKQPPAPGERIHLGWIKGALTIHLLQSLLIPCEIGIAA